tara:strand:- start:16563 stop:17810 length:1248 start_codon:yes stop_codon:yes gene_type:complete
MSYKISVIGLGYVGLPLAVAFSKSHKVAGFDVNKKRISELSTFQDSTLEVSAKTLKQSTNLSFSSSKETLVNSDIYIATVPTPIDQKNNPDLTMLKSACETVGSAMKKESIVVFESTVYPGCTEEICVPILEKFSGLKLNKDFYVGYSPERINPGDKNHGIGDIVKIVSASNKHSLDILHDLYSKIIPAGLHKATSIKVAEAAKIIENTQRDINIALMNEFSLILKKLNIDSNEVLEAAGTKWNFHKYTPGLVGGHCIGVDPYYLTYKAKKLGINPRVILSGRQVNDSMHKEVARFLLTNTAGTNNKILILGATFKENCPDIRNSRVENFIFEMNQQGIIPHLYDPFLNKRPNFQGQFTLLRKWPSTKYDGVFLAVPHQSIISKKIADFLALLKRNGVMLDFKSVLPQHKKIIRW